MPPEENGQPPQNPPAADLAGYQDVPSLVQGYRESGKEAQKWRDRALQLEQLMTVQNARPSVPAPRAQDPAQRLSEWGMPVQDLDELINQRIGQVFEPIAKAGLARNDMLSRYSDYNKFESDVAQYITSDPEMNQRYQRLFATEPVAAMEYAYLKFGESRRKTDPTPSEPQKRARSEAQIPSSRAGDARTQPEASEQEAVGRAWDHYQKTGNPTAYAKARLRGVIRDEFLSR